MQIVVKLSRVSKKMDELCVSTLSISVLLISMILYFIQLKLRAGRTDALPPGPWGLPIIGYLPFMIGKNVLRHFTDLGHRHGPIYKLQLGKKLIVVISSPSLVKEVVRDQDMVFADREAPIAALAATYGANDIAWSRTNSQWRLMRKIFVQQMMSNASLEASYALRKDEVRKTIRNVYTNMGKPIKIGEIAFQAELNAMMNMLWGATIQAEERERVGWELWAMASKIIDLLGKPNISDFFPALARFDIQGIKRETEACVRSVERVFNDIIAKHKKKLLSGEIKNQGEKDFLTILIELMETQGSETSINETQLKAILMDVIVGGTDTSTRTIEWIIAELLNNPKVMMKAHKELYEVVGTNNIVEEFHIPQLKFLKAIVKETLRLHPVAPFLPPRCPKQSSTVGGYTIPKNSMVLINVASIQRDPYIWDNSIEFKPERFLGDNGILEFRDNNFNFLSFGSGRRLCAGLPLAERMLIYFIASLLHSFEWKLPNDEILDMSEALGLILRKSTPLVAIPYPRFSDPNLYV